MRALLTDFYELTMAASYLRRGMEAPATFSLFVRALPPSRGFLVAAGLESCLTYLEAFRFTDDDLVYLRAAHGFDDDVLAAFAAMRFDGDVWAVPEGRVVLAGEPLLEVTAPLPVAQVVETYLLNQITFETAIASKAARCRIAAGDAAVVDFSFRRTHGVEGAMAAARGSAIAGFAATSNVEAARRYRLRATGTMAHSYVEAFPTERDAFRAFAEDFPDRTVFLVDTYDTVEGVRTAIEVAREMRLGGGFGVRLDSGDLAALAREARRLLDEAGFPDAEVIASGGLDEYGIEDLVRAGAPIDAYGVGTRMGVSADAPSLDSAYKLVAYDGRPVMKRSPGKATLPGAKQVLRAREPLADTIALRDESAPPDTEALLEPAFRGGQRVAPPCELDEARKRLEADLSLLPAEALRIREPRAPEAGISDRLRALTDELSRR